MAGLNYANKNPNSTFSNEELMKGYSASVSSSLLVAITLRKLTQNLTRTATGTKLILLNTLVGSLASASAGFCNTTLMRKPEVD